MEVSIVSVLWFLLQSLCHYLAAVHTVRFLLCLHCFHWCKHQKCECFLFFSLLCFGLMEKGGLFKMMVVWCKHDLKSLPLIKCSSFVQKKMHQTENDTYPACHIICIQMSQQTQKKCTRTVFLCWKLQACNLSSLAIFSLFLFIGISWSKKPLSAGICFVVLCLCDGF